MPFTQELLKYVTYPYFIETGTYQGDMVQTLLQHTTVPENIISLELSEVFFKRCTDRFKDQPKVKIYHANSKVDLYPIIRDIKHEITFWLDSHWSGVEDVGEDSVLCPILEELDQISRHPIHTHTLMIDDIRLMNGSKDKYHGFEVYLDQIIEKILEINPQYTIQFHDDYTGKNDVLVAYIKPVCIHHYLTNCKTNPQAPGFADFLRGTIALFNLSETYGYQLKFNRTHPLFSYLKEKDALTGSLPDTVELLPPISYPEIYQQLNQVFSTRQSFQTITNSFYTHQGHENWGPITVKCSIFLHDLLQPRPILADHIEKQFALYNIHPKSPFRAVHIRTGDHNLHHHQYDDSTFPYYYHAISNLLHLEPTPLIVVTDSSILGKKLKEHLPIGYVENEKVHLGDLVNNTENAILNTLGDFFILSKAKVIYYAAFSGFSKAVSLIYHIPYLPL